MNDISNTGEEGSAWEYTLKKNLHSGDSYFSIDYLSYKKWYPEGSVVVP